MSAEVLHQGGSGDHDAVNNSEPAVAHVADMPRSFDPGAQASGNGLVPGANDHPASATDDVIDVQAVARLLHVGRNTVYALVARNAIPHRRLGNRIRFHRAAVMRWLASWSLQGAKERQ
jgi:excisionase family DNA binding protein